ncbi:MAG: EcsC family protein [Myxococcota bacterium]|nr:EcsC family protein [Myxococcota bacterium]
MPSPWKNLTAGLEERLDEELLPAIYATLSVSTQTLRDELERLGHAMEPSEASAYDLDAAADDLINASAKRSMAVGAVGGVGGIVAIPPEIMAQLVGSLRLAQRLAVLYGFDPETELGAMLLWHAMAEAHGVTLPKEGSLDIRFRDLPRALGAQKPDTREAAAWMVRQIVRRAIRNTTRKFTRWIPGLTVGLSARGAFRQTKSQGASMKAVFRRATSQEPATHAPIEEAEEV